VGNVQSGKSVTDVAKRAHEELAAAMVALQHAGALFAAIEKASTVDGDLNGAFLLAQIGVETTAYQVDRAEAEADFFAEVCHG
jgi:hypothetical protein